MENLKSSVALVTGGSSGIGRATALTLAEKGVKVVVSSRDGEEGEKTLSLIRSQGGDGIFVHADVSQAEDVHNLVKACVRQYGRLDYAVNNAGIVGEPFVPTAEYSEETWDEVIAVNLKGVWLGMKYQIPEMLKTGGGSIVNMSSVSGLKGGPVGVAYYASKHGVIGATKAAALEYADKNIRINAICPAVIKTPMAESVFGGDALSNRILAKHPIGRLGTPEDIAKAVIWLCSDDASFVTGHALVVDGGFML